MPYTYDYPRPAVTTDNIIFGFDGKGLSVLLIKRGIEPFKGEQAFPGGFLNMDETAEEGARRKLQGEAGVKDIYIEQLQAFSDVNRDPRGRIITIAFMAFVRQQDYEVIGGEDAEEAQWTPIDKIENLAFDHGKILKTALDRLRWKITYEPLAFRLLNSKFTMTQVRTIYEVVLGHPLDRGNFRKKILSLGYIIPEKETVPSNGRPATLYRFDEEKYREVIAKRNIW